MGYYRDLSKTSIEAYKLFLHDAELIPSWRILKEDIDKRLSTIQKEGIHNLQELKERLKTKQKVVDFAVMSKLPEDYLNILRRVVNGYHPKPNAFKDFQNISSDIAEILKSHGFKNTLHLYPYILTSESRKKLSSETGIESEEVEKLASLTDLSRIRWVNHTFAFVLYQCGFRKAREIAATDPIVLYEKVLDLNKREQIYKAHIGANDMKMVIEAARSLEFEIEFDH